MCREQNNIEAYEYIRLCEVPLSPPLPSCPMALAAFLVTPYNASSGVNPIKVQPMFITSNNDEQGADPEREPRENRERTERHRGEISTCD